MINYVVHCNIISERFLWVFENSSSKIFNSISASYPLHKLIPWKSLYCGMLLPFHLIFSPRVVRSIACSTSCRSMPLLRAGTCELPAQPVSPDLLAQIRRHGRFATPIEIPKCHRHFTISSPASNIIQAAKLLSAHDAADASAEETPTMHRGLHPHRQSTASCTLASPAKPAAK